MSPLLDSTFLLFFSAALLLNLSAVLMGAPSSVVTGMFPSYKPDDRGFNVSALFMYTCGWWSALVGMSLFLLAMDCSKVMTPMAICLHGNIYCLYLLATNETPYPTMLYDKMPFIIWATCLSGIPVIAVAGYILYMEQPDQMQLVYFAGGLALIESIFFGTSMYHHKQLAKKLEKVGLTMAGVRSDKTHFRSTLQKMSFGGLQSTNEDLAELFDRVDGDKSGCIDAKEFNAVGAVLSLDAATMTKLFDAADVNKDGTICKDEFINVMNEPMGTMPVGKMGKKFD